MSLKAIIVVPAFNEAGRIEVMLRDYLETFDATVGLHIVLNGCSDNTLHIVTKYQRSYPQRVTYEEHAETGKGRAVRLGWQAVQAQYIGVADADNATNAQEYAKLLDALIDSGVDGVIASRYADGAMVRDRNSVLRRVAARVFRLLVTILFDLPYTDTQCGAKIFKQSVIRQVAPQLVDNTMSFDVELLWLCKRYRYRIIEVPINWTETMTSPFMATPLKTIGNALVMFNALLRLRIRTLFVKY